MDGQTNKQTSKQASKQTNKQKSKQANMRSGLTWNPFQKLWESGRGGKTLSLVDIPKMNKIALAGMLIYPALSEPFRPSEWVFYLNYPDCFQTFMESPWILGLETLAPPPLQASTSKW